MLRAFDPCEVDFFGDLAGDTHGLWEVFEFVRLHHSDLSGEQVFERGRQYLADWIDARWICISEAPLHPSTITSLAQIPEFLQRHGLAVTRYLENSPSIDITEEAQHAYDAHI